MSLLITYIGELYQIHQSGAGVQETSYYGPLERLFNELGKTLKPPVRCIMQLKNRDAGNPDGGLFAASQIPRDGPPAPDLLPERGAVEVKGTAPDVEQAAITEAGAALGLAPEQALACLGPQTRDVALNPGAHWANVPDAVWNYIIGGYQVVKKWLSYREAELLKRPLTIAEAREVSAMVRRLAALLLAPALDANYARVAAAVYPWAPAL
ncbi:MAG TPA: type ISP restriction/modification enzyme [Chloroflexia bacterium]|nr:type ISP restriction/modification enzyme [Chloroflexia bacterium]